MLLNVKKGDVNMDNQVWQDTTTSFRETMVVLADWGRLPSGNILELVKSTFAKRNLLLDVCIPPVGGWRGMYDLFIEVKFCRDGVDQLYSQPLHRVCRGRYPVWVTSQGEDRSPYDIKLEAIGRMAVEFLAKN